MPDHKLKPKSKSSTKIWINNWVGSDAQDRGVVKHGSVLPSDRLCDLVRDAVSFGFYFSVSPTENGDMIFFFDTRRLISR